MHGRTGLPHHPTIHCHVPPLQPAGQPRRLEQTRQCHKALPVVQRAGIACVLRYYIKIFLLRLILGVIFKVCASALIDTKETFLWIVTFLKVAQIKCKRPSYKQRHGRALKE